MPLVTVDVAGLSKFAKAAKQVDRELGKAIRQAMLTVAKLAETKSHTAMRAGGRQASKATRGVRAKATQKMAAISTVPSPPLTLGVVWGMTRRSGWYRKGRYYESAGRQFRPWVGNQWDPGEAGGMPYFVGPAINQTVDEAVDILGDAFVAIAEQAGFTAD